MLNFFTYFSMRRIERFDIYLKHKGLNDNIVTNDLGISIGTIGKSRKEGRDLSNRVIELILNFYTDLSRRWLLTGEGEMLVDNTIEVDGTPKEGEQNSDVIYSIPFIDKSIATAPDINIRRLVQEKAHTLEEFPFYKMVKDVDYIQTVITMAMAPRYLPGDFLFIRFRDGQVLSGKIYLVDTKTYGTMLRLVYIEEGGYVLKAFNPAFKSVFVKSEDVYSISSVVLSVNTNTSLTSDVDLASLVKSRDEQIISLQKTQDAFIEQQQSLIDEIRKQNERIDRIQKRNEDMVDKLLSKE